MYLTSFSLIDDRTDALRISLNQYRNVLHYNGTNWVCLYSVSECSISIVILLSAQQFKYFVKIVPLIKYLIIGCVS